MATFKKAFEPKLIYVYRILDSAHEGVLKIGETESDAGMEYFSLQPNSKSLNDSAKARIRHQTQTAGVQWELLYTEITAYMKDGELCVFQDHEIHEILKRSGIEKRIFYDDDGHKSNEWFVTDLETIKKGISAAKEGRTSLSASEISHDKSPIIFRPEQKEAINRTIKQFTKKVSSNQMLWNAKMRFGKTLTALQVIKQLNFKKTLILTHRPVVDKGWFEDYSKIFYDRPDFYYFSRNNGGNAQEESQFYKMLKSEDTKNHFIYFASIQDMRGSEVVGGKYDKNKEIYDVNWDFIIIDEAHEGTQTELGKNVISICKKDNTKILHLSGTPFNLMDDFNEEEIYTWDYVMEQKAKEDWERLHEGDPNPYACLPRLNIYTYNLGKLYPQYADADVAFNFREFLRVDNSGNFIHEMNINQFLNLLTKEDPESNYPYSKPEYRENFRHSLWIIPGVKEAKALSKLLQKHPVFSQFEIVNVAGDGDEEVDSTDALAAVEKAMGPNPENTYTITLSCGRLTTGVSVKPWTACFMLAGTYSTTASSYMQTIFRVQTPAIIGGKQKEECFVFDFAPDRTLKVIAETAKISSKAGQTSGNDRIILGNFLNFCPIIGFEGSKMVEYDTPRMLEQLKKAYVERVVKNGFEDGYLYNNDLMKLNDLEIKAFADLKAIIGITKASPKSSDIDINAQGLTNEEYEELQKPKKQKEKRELTPEEEELRRKLLEAKKMRDSAISILRGISIRMPLLIYGAELKKNPDGTEKNEDLTIDNFTSLIDDLSWEEFMPAKVTKEKFEEFKKYYDPEVFHSAARRIREMTKAADNYSIEERIERISSIFNTFRNPDKETVLTPWKVVNLHMTDCLGGWKFYDKDFKELIQEPEYVEVEDVTKNVYKKNSKILEINSKSGLYALFCAYSIYRNRAKLELGPNPTKEMEKALWNKVLQENIFLICKTPMAQSIAKRTLIGFTDAKVNTHHFEDLIMQLKEKPDNFKSKILNPGYWKQEGGTFMKFDAIVGNPPYQIMDGGNGSSSAPIYDKFVDIAKQINPNYISMIMPSRWMTGGKGLDSFRERMIEDKHIEILHDYLDSSAIFSNVLIEGGICYFLRSESYTGKCHFYTHNKGDCFVSERYLKEAGSDVVIRDPNAVIILNKVLSKTKKNSFFNNLVYPRKPFIEDEASLKFTNKESTYKVLGRFDNKREIRNISNDFKLTKNKDLAEKYKVFVSKADGAAGQIGNPIPAKIIGKSEFGDKNTLCTETFLAIGPFENKKEAKNVMKYLDTKFCRFMIGIRKTKNMTQDTYSFVPLQDFNNGDIDWSLPIKDIDKKLYKKYGLEEKEYSFIEKMIKDV